MKNDFLSLRFVLIRFVLFAAIYIGLSLLFTLEPLKQGHNSFFSTVITPLQNIINPDTYAVFKKENSTDRMHFGVSISLYDKSKHGIKLRNKRYREKTNAEVVKYPNLHPLIFLPTILLIALFIATPVNWKIKLLRMILGIALFYLIMVFYFSYVFELTLNNGQFSIDSFWHFIIRIFGANSAETISLYAVLIWGILCGPLLYKKYGDIFK